MIRNNSSPIRKNISIILTIIVIGGGIFWLNQYKQKPSQNYNQTTPQTKYDPNANRGTKINQTSIYENTTLGFQMTFPEGWYLPPSNTLSIHMYSCPTYKCPDGVIQIQQNNFYQHKNFEDLLFEERESGDPNAKEIENLIDGARVIKARNLWNDEGLPFLYKVVFYNQKKEFFILTDRENLEASILSSFKILP